MLAKEGDVLAQLKDVLRGLEYKARDLHELMDSTEAVTNYDKVTNVVEHFALDLMDAAILVADVRMGPRPPKVLEAAEELYRAVDSLRYTLRFFIDSRYRLK